MLGELLFICFLGSALLLTRQEIGPILIHRPIAMGPLLGSTVGLGPEGFLLGACFEWIWIDRIPAGGIRVPAVSVGVTSSLVTLIVARYHAEFANVAPAGLFPLALVLGAVGIVLFIPVDGGLRRLWNITSEGVLAALDRGSVRELRIYAAVVLFFRLVLVAVGYLMCAVVASYLLSTVTESIRRTSEIGWAWIIPAGLFGFLMRRHKRKELVLGTICFLTGIGLACLR